MHGGMNFSTGCSIFSISTIYIDVELTGFQVSVRCVGGLREGMRAEEEEKKDERWRVAESLKKMSGRKREKDARLEGDHTVVLKV